MERSFAKEVQALRLYRKALDLYRDYVAAYHSLARLLLRKGGAEEGRQWLQVFQRMKQYEALLMEESLLAHKRRNLASWMNLAMKIMQDV